MVQSQNTQPADSMQRQMVPGFLASLIIIIIIIIKKILIFRRHNMESNSRAPSFEMNGKNGPSEKVSFQLVLEILPRVRHKAYRYSGRWYPAC